MSAKFIKFNEHLVNTGTIVKISLHIPANDPSTKISIILDGVRTLKEYFDNLYDAQKRFAELETLLV